MKYSSSTKHAMAVMIAAMCLMAMLAATPRTAIGQITTASIVGTVLDPSQAPVASATVTARNVDTGLTRTVQTDADGNYRIDILPIGNYVVEITAAAGFKKAVHSGVVLQVNDVAKVDVNLEVGAVSEEVTVTTGAAEINTETAELGRTVQSREIENLPLVERNVYSLLDLTPGVQSNNTGLASASPTTSNLSLGFPEQRTLINGGTDGGTGSVNYFLDGGTNMTYLRNTGNSLPNPDAIQEFRVQTNAYSAEYGRFANGIINVLTKSGTNNFHGSLYEFVRNDVFNANEWGSVVTKPPYRRNQYGGTIGGPIKHDRTFFFFSYAGLRQMTNTFLAGARVPSLLERQGNFTETVGTLTDPATKQPFECPDASGKNVRVICPNRIDPVARKIIDTYIPLPNTTLTTVNGTFPGWQGNVPNPYNSDEFLTKVDHQLTKNHRLTFSYFETSGETVVFPGNTNNPLVPWATQDFKWRQHDVNLSDVWVINSDKVNQVWLTYARNFGGRNNNPSTSLRDLGSSAVIQGTPSLPQITVTGYFTLQNAIGGPTAGTNLYSVRDVFSWIKGRHSFKIGGEESLNKDIQDTLLNNYGVFTFGSGASTGNALANFEIGIPTAVTQDAPVTAYTNSWNTSLYVQDDFKASSRVTLNMGLRWDVQTPPTDPLNRVMNYVPGVKSIVNPTAPAGPQFYGDPGVERGGIPISYTHFSPRFGIAWDPFGDGKTSIRGAAGLFWGSLSGNEWNTMTNFQPFATRLTFANINAATTSAGVPLGASLSNPYTAFPGGPPFPYTGAFVTGGAIFPVAIDFTWPRTFQTNVSIQRQVTRGLAVTLAYVGTRASHLPFGRDINYPIPSSTATTAGANVLARRPNPAFGAITQLNSDQSASYDGMQLSWQYRMGKRLLINGFYVFSKTLSTAELHNNTTQGIAQNFTKLYLEKGRADTDQTHVFSLSGNYEPDFYHGDDRIAKAIINGWSLSPIVRIRSGRPFTVANGVDANLDGTSGPDRARLIGDPHLDHPTTTMWFNTAAFAQNPVVNGVVTEGNSPRNFLSGPGFFAVDLALSRDFRFGERFKLRLRAESTNVTNHPNYDLPGATVPANGGTSATFGRISSAGQMRKLQFGARLTF